MTPEQRQILGDLMDGTLSDEGYLRKVGIRRSDAAKLSLNLLEDAYRMRDSEAVTYGLLVGFRFGFLPDHLDVLRRLSEAEWHVGHEDVVSALDEFRDKRAVETFYKAALKLHPYLDYYDDCRALAVKAIWALGNLRDPTADEKLRLLAQSDEKIVREAALEQLRRRDGQSTS